MSVFPYAKGATIAGGYFVGNSIAIANVSSNDIVGRLHSLSATAGLLDAKERFNAPKCDEGTRISMIKGMKKFVQAGNTTAPPALYWLHGPAGVGKSALAQSLSLSLQAEGDHAASFFFSRTSSGRSDGNQLVVTLAYQLATNIPELQPFMSKVLQGKPAIHTASNVAQMQSLIIDPINEWYKKHFTRAWGWSHRFSSIRKRRYPRLILVDGLDECSNPEVQSDLIRCIALAVRQLAFPFRFVITSRPKSHILATFELDPAFQGHNGVKVTKQNLGEDDDEEITAFLMKEFAEIRRTHPIRDILPEPWPHPDQIKDLVSRSSNYFIYPTTVMRYIKMPHNRPDVCLERILGVSEIPASDKPYEPLDLFYRHIFDSVTEVSKYQIHNVIHFLLVPSTWDGSTDVMIIETHFGYPPGHLQHLLGDLDSLVVFTANGHIKFLHASLPDFLLDRSRSGPLFVDVRDAHATVAASYLSWIRDMSGTPIHQDFVTLLGHLEASNMSNEVLHDRIADMDLLHRFKQICTAVATHGQGSQSTLNPDEIKSIAFIIAYLLVLVIQNVPENYINCQIGYINRHIFTEHPWIKPASTHKFTKIMVPLFRTWKVTTYSEPIRRIFERGVESSQNRAREAIFALYFLMMTSLHREYIQNHPTTDYPTDGIVKMGSYYWADIVMGQ